jgi:hypothetical protein
MRLWSLHPKYLDAKGLVALWREGLLARKVLTGKTKGYTHHPQLERFRHQQYPLAAIDTYLRSVYNEAAIRGYSFDRTKFRYRFLQTTMPVTSGQLRYELEHLKKKLRKRDRAKFKEIEDRKIPEAHPLFSKIPGRIEPWEREH